MSLALLVAAAVVLVCVASAVLLVLRRRKHPPTDEPVWLTRRERRVLSKVQRRRYWRARRLWEAQRRPRRVYGDPRTNGRLETASQRNRRKRRERLDLVNPYRMYDPAMQAQVREQRAQLTDPERDAV